MPSQRGMSWIFSPTITMKSDQSADQLFWRSQTSTWSTTTHGSISCGARGRSTWTLQTFHTPRIASPANFNAGDWWSEPWRCWNPRRWISWKFQRFEFFFGMVNGTPRTIVDFGLSKLRVWPLSPCKWSKKSQWILGNLPRRTGERAFECVARGSAFWCHHRECLLHLEWHSRMVVAIWSPCSSGMLLDVHEVH